jgi:hypothetical protein
MNAKEYRSTWYEIVLEDIGNLSTEELKKVSNFIVFNLRNDKK